MKKIRIFLTLILILNICFSRSINAQNKKKLKAEIAKLKNEKELLAKRLNDKEAEAKSLNIEVSNLEKKNFQLQTELKNTKIDYKTLDEEYKDYKAEQQAKQKSKAEALKAAQKCQFNKLNLQLNQSYTLDFKKLNVHGWGLQVYSFTNLCLAKQKADVFSQKYTLYKTYIRVKEVNDSKVYAVIYGSLKHKNQAKIYCDNFKNIAEDLSAKNAFLVQH